MSVPSSPDRRVLVACTANVCRSPVAAHALAREWAACDVPAVVGSAGTGGGRLAVHPYTVEAAGFARIDLSDHRSRAVTAEMIATEGAHLVIGMTREHLRAAIQLDPACWPRAFTLRELARRTEKLREGNDRDTLEVSDWDDWLAACGDGRDKRTLLIPDLLDDLPDPYGKPAGIHILMVQEIILLARAIAVATPHETSPQRSPAERPVPPPATGDQASS